MRFKAVVLLTGMVVAGYVSAFACDQTKEAKAELTTTPAVASFAVSGMHCGNCAGYVKETLSKMEGVQNVIVSFEDSRALVEYNPEKVKGEALLTTAQSTGFTVFREVKEVEASKLSSEKGCDASKASSCPHMSSQLSGEGKSCCGKKAKKGTT